MRLPLALSASLALAGTALAYEGQLAEGDCLLVTSHRPDALVAIDREGEILWRSDLPLKHPQQVSALPDGRVFCATIDGAWMLNPDGSEQWKYTVPEGAENATALHLGPGRHLVAHEGRGKLVTLNDRGEAVSVTRVEPINDKVHGQFRYVGFGDGNYLVPMTSGSTFREIEPESGEVLWEIRNLKLVTSALRRADGGTYICNRDTLSAYDHERALEWSVSFTADCGFAKAVPPTGFVQLPAGNLIIAFWHKHDDVPDLIEFDPAARKIVHQWDLNGLQQMGCVAHLPPQLPFLQDDHL